MTIHAFGLNCTLKSGDAASSTQTMLDQVLRAMAKHGATTSHARVANFDVKPGVTADEGDGDEWPTLLAQVMAADILVLATPIWMGQPCSIAKRVLERLDAVLGDIDDDGRYPTFGKVAVCARENQSQRSVVIRASAPGLRRIATCFAQDTRGDPSRDGASCCTGGRRAAPSLLRVRRSSSSA